MKQRNSKICISDFPGFNSGFLRFNVIIMCFADKV